MSKMDALFNLIYQKIREIRLKIEEVIPQPGKIS